jgi:hypothetical protein
MPSLSLLKRPHAFAGNSRNRAGKLRDGIGIGMAPERWSVFVVGREVFV